jgi:hypothetical protein
VPLPPNVTPRSEYSAVYWFSGSVWPAASLFEKYVVELIATVYCCMHAKKSWT